MAPRELPPLDIRSRSQQYTERTDTLHLSQITNDILLTGDPEKYGDKDGADEGKWMNFLVGLIFERAIELAWMDKEIEGNFRPGLIRPGEVVCDGITGTPDVYDTSTARPLEFKCTKKSCRQSILDKKFWMYWVQLKAYCWMLKQAGFGCNSGELHILHVMGNWSRDDNDPENGYIIKSWYDEWSDLELEENWMMLRGHAVRRGWLKRESSGLYVPVVEAA